MSKRVNLLEGNILNSLIKMSLPIMATSLLQMAYNMTDMIWIGKMGSDSVAAVGVAGMFINFGWGLSAFARVGGQVKVAQAYGSGNHDLAAKYSRNSIQISVIMAVIYSIIICVFYKQFVAFFKFTNPVVVNQGEIYLFIMGLFSIFNFTNPTFTALITATGNSKTPFVVSTIGLIINLILDPIMIFGLVGCPKMGVAGAAYATIIAQAMVFVLYILYFVKDNAVFNRMNMKAKLNFDLIKEIVKIGMPATVQEVMFTGISMVIGRIIAVWSETAIAVQKVGIQIESISYMAADGFAAASNSFIGQNYGAKNLKRAKKGYNTAFVVVTIWGLITSAILIFAPAPIFEVFISQADVVPLGVDYLVILGYSQFFMCIDILTTGAFSAYGKTLAPSLLNVVLTGMRIPMSYILGQTALGINGVWWSISLTSVFKGIILVIMYMCFMKKLNNQENMQNNLEDNTTVKEV